MQVGKARRAGEKGPCSSGHNTGKRTVPERQRPTEGRRKQASLSVENKKPSESAEEEPEIMLWSNNAKDLASNLAKGVFKKDGAEEASRKTAYGHREANRIDDTLLHRAPRFTTGHHRGKGSCSVLSWTFLFSHKDVEGDVLGVFEGSIFISAGSCLGIIARCCPTNHSMLSGMFAFPGVDLHANGRE